MTYVKTDWTISNLTPENLNKMQLQYQEAVDNAIGIRSDNAELRCEVVNDFPEHKVGRIIFHSVLKTFFFSNGTSWFIQPFKQAFGSSALGNFSSTKNITFTNTVGETVVKNYRNFTLNAGHTLTTENPAHLLAIRAWGDIVIDGTIDMNYKGGYGDVSITLFGQSISLTGGDGGNGGDGAYNSGSGGTGNYARWVAGGRIGGGGGGGGSLGGQGGGKNGGGADGASYTPSVVAQATKTNYQNVNGVSGAGAGQGGSGRAGAEGVTSSNSLVKATSYGGQANLHKGATGGGAHATVYDDNKQIQTLPGTAGQLGGGVILLLAMGSVTINGQLLANGGAGGNGADGITLNKGVYTFASAGGGGGGSGGGRILIIHQNGYTETGNVDLSGGAGGRGYDTGVLQYFGQAGQAGTSGSMDIIKL